MTEEILIEIAQRFRKLEDAVEAVDIYRLTKGLDSIQKWRDDIETMIEACREDMTAMQERIRKCAEGRCG